VETGKDPAIRSQIARAMVERGWGLFEMRPIGLSLEEIFLKLTAKEEAVERAALDEGRDGGGSSAVGVGDPTDAGGGAA
jgi:hypothetical protein